jgi:hypothetical protein
LSVHTENADRLFADEMRVVVRFGTGAGRDRIVSFAAPRLTAGKPAQAEPTAAQDAMSFHCFEEVVRAGRLKPATAARSAQPGEHRRDRPLITADQKSDDQAHQGARIKARFARRNHSSRSAPYEAFAAAGRAINTSQNPPRISCCCERTISRNRRRTRFRFTAPPMRREVTKPARKGAPVPTVSTPSTMNAPRCTWPSVLTRRNSADRVNRCAFPNVSGRGFCCSFIAGAMIVRKRARSPAALSLAVQ